MNSMTGKERLERIKLKLRAKGYRPTPLSYYEASRQEGADLDKLANDLAAMDEAMWNTEYIPMHPLYESDSKWENFKDWLEWKIDCFVDIFRRWKIRQENKHFDKMTDEELRNEAKKQT